mmetsp:Transcript_25998/g.36450  ORF Transcript_25998/g.36450 Transcript_25998/m.36450 type:complete len:82 (-) Transcript_25998:741-986(-)
MQCKINEFVEVWMLMVHHNQASDQHPWCCTNSHIVLHDSTFVYFPFSVLELGCERIFLCIAAVNARSECNIAGYFECLKWS